MKGDRKDRAQRPAALAVKSLRYEWVAAAAGSLGYGEDPCSPPLVVLRPAKQDLS